MSAIKVQGETYANEFELLAAAAKLEAQAEDLPESHPGRADISEHVARMRAAAGVEFPEPAAVQDGETEPESSRATVSAPPPPAGESDEEIENEEEEETGAPPSAFLCPVCMGRGFFPVEPPLDPKTEMCRRCHGYGKVMTGSHVSGHETRDCPDCLGNGYIDRVTVYAPQENGKASPSPGWQGAQWNAEEEVWEPPYGAGPPWTGAVWDKLRGTYE